MEQFSETKLRELSDGNKTVATNADETALPNACILN
jgi:hypothetical protein